MVALKDLQRDLARALEANDLDAAASVRRAIVDNHEGLEVAEAAYKLGLDALYRKKDLAAAADLLRQAGKAKHPDWSLPARVSLGLVLLAAGKPQQAVFELRKAASAKPASLLTAQAAGLIALALAQSNPGAEVERARDKFKSALEALTKNQPPEVEAWAALYLGMEFKHDGMREDARKWLLRAQTLQCLPEAESESLARSLAQL